MYGDEMEQLQGQIQHARAIIIRDTQALREAKTGRDSYEIRTLEMQLEQQRAQLGELLQRQTRLAAAHTG